MYIVGKTGVGKSTILHNLMADDLSSGRGIALIAPHGNLSDLVADIALKNRKDAFVSTDLIPRSPSVSILLPKFRWDKER